jgi:hypothetical protein
MSVSIDDIAHRLSRPVACLASWHAGWQLCRFLRGLSQCRRVQGRLLASILQANADSDFGRRHGFSRIRSYADFAHAVPLADFSYHAPYVERCKAGELNALFGPSQKLLMFATTSGTTGDPKYIPVTSRFMAAYHRGWNIWAIKYLADHPQAYLRRVLQVSAPLENERTSGGHLCGSISAALARHQKRIVRYFYAVPADIGAIPDAQARYYVTMRFALMADIGTIVTANPSVLVMLAQIAEKNALSLIRDIHDGSIDSSINLPSEVRSRLMRRLRSNPGRSRVLEQLLQEHGRLLPRHYWNPAALGHWTGGTVHLYLPQVREYYGDRPVRDIGLLASEGRMSIPLEDNTPAGPLDIRANFYEFVPEDQVNSLGPCAGATTLPGNLTVLRADELDTGRVYSIFLTNDAGLYRYHIGDLVRVTDRMGSTPVIAFLSRGAHTSSVTGEKLTEYQVVAAVGAVMREGGDHVTTFAVAPVWAQPPHYLLCFKSPKTHSADVLSQLAERIDEALGQLNAEYKSKRQSQRLGPLQIRQLRGEAGVLDDTCAAMSPSHHEQSKHRFLFAEPLRTESLAMLGAQVPRVTARS